MTVPILGETSGQKRNKKRKKEILAHLHWTVTTTMRVASIGTFTVSEHYCYTCTYPLLLSLLLFSFKKNDFSISILGIIGKDIGVRVAEARTCESKSHRFKGTCIRKSNCAAVCQTEGFHGGHCRGFRRRCFCTRHC